MIENPRKEKEDNIDKIIKKAPIKEEVQTKTILANVPIEIHEELKITAVKKRINMKDLIAGILIDFVENNKNK
jgi:hypothetical protein